MENDQTSIVSRPIRGSHPNVSTVRDVRDQQPSGNAREVTPTLENVSITLSKDIFLWLHFYRIQLIDGAMAEGK